MLYFLCFLNFVLFAGCIYELYACCIFMFYFHAVWNFPYLCCVCVVCRLFKKTEKNDVLYFSAHWIRSGISYYILSARVTHSGILCYVFCVCNMLRYFCYIFSACGTRSGILCYISLCVESALIFCVIFFHVWNALWYFVLHFSAYGTHNSILYFIFPQVEHALVLFVIFFLCCIIINLISLNVFFTDFVTIFNSLEPFRFAWNITTKCWR